MVNTSEIKQLRVNADDFGFTPGVSDGIVHAFQNGIVTHTSILANGLDFHRATNIARNLPELNIGIHLILSWGRPILPATAIPSLTDTAGTFLNISRIISKILQKRLCLNELEKEWSAQVEQVLSAGIVPTHIDSHHHIHLLPGCFTVAGKIAKKYQIPYLRRPAENWRHFNGYHGFLKRIGFRLLCIRYWPVQSSDYFYGLSLQENHRFSEMLINLVCHLHPKLTEIMVHPGYVDNLLINTDTYCHPRKVELDALCNPALKDVLRENNVQLDRNGLKTGNTSSLPNHCTSLYPTT